MNEELRKLLVKHTKCDVQTNNWPCGTCTIDLLEKNGVAKERLNDVWQAILDIRDYEMSKL